jgi:hypothetical protein
MITGSNGRFIVSARRVFPRFAGVHAVTITVSDSQGRIVSATESVSFASHPTGSIAATHQAKPGAKSHRYSGQGRNTPL